MQKLFPQISLQKVSEASLVPEVHVQAPVTINIEHQKEPKTCIKLLTDKEGNSDLSHISTGTADTNMDFKTDEMSGALECTAIRQRDVKQVS